MNFSILSDCHKKWQDILVIGKTIERDGKKYHILGRTVFTGTVSAGKNHMHDALEQSCPKGIRSCTIVQPPMTACSTASPKVFVPISKRSVTRYKE